MPPLVERLLLSPFARRHDDLLKISLRDATVPPSRPIQIHLILNERKSQRGVVPAFRITKRCCSVGTRKPASFLCVTHKSI